MPGRQVTSTAESVSVPSMFIDVQFVYRFYQCLITDFYIGCSLIFTRFRDIAAFVLQYAAFSHTTSSLPQISPCSPGSRWVAFGLRSAKVLG